MSSTWSPNPFPSVSLDAAGLVALADLKTISIRSALTGTSTYLDMFVICPGIHLQQHAPELNGGELPQAASIETGYVFRVENPGTVAYLQRVGQTGHLITVQVSLKADDEPESRLRRLWRAWWTPTSSLVASACYLAAILLTVLSLFFIVFIRDWWALGILLSLIFARVCNIFISRRRSQAMWKGHKEDHVQDELIVILSQDRWIRMKGFNNDLKLVTAGQWLRDMEFWERSVASGSTLLVYLDAALASNASQVGKMLILGLLLSSAALLAMSNEWLGSMEMFGATLKAVGEDKPKGFRRRMDMVDYVVDESQKDQWAIGLGLKHAKEFKGQ
jgi:hypothetical protein